MTEPQLFAIESRNTKLLEAILEDLKILGYNLTDYPNLRNPNRVLTNNLNTIYSFPKGEYKVLVFDAGTTNRSSNKVKFFLPAQYQEALEFAKIQINHPYWNRDQFKVGDWIIASKAIKPEPDQIIEITENYYKCLHDKNIYGFLKERKEEIGLRLATTDEIQAFLIEEAKKRGFKKGIYFRSAYSNRIAKCLDNFEYNKIQDSLSSNDYNIYYKGKWAEIISSNKELYFGDVKFTIKPNSAVAEISYGNISKNEIYTAIVQLEEIYNAFD